MSKLTGALLIVFLIELSLVFFGGTTYDKSSLYSFLINPTGFGASVFYLAMAAILAVSALATVVPGAFYQVNQWALFAVAGVSIITFVANITHLWAFINGQLVGIFSNPTMGGLIASLITAPLLIFYIVAVIEWTRQN